jgi:formylmethanofuran dehydrogenase subunit B
MPMNSKLTNVTCPACGLLCDDIVVSSVQQGATIENACAKGITFFNTNISNSSATIAGKPVDITQALLRAAEILNASKKAIFAGLSTDLAGFRAAYQTAQTSKATMLHMNAQSSWRNMHVLQSSGWQTTTLTEVKNRADVILCIGTDVVKHNPRFFERNVWVKDAMFVEPSTRDIIYLGGQNLDTSDGVSPNGVKPTVLACSIDSMPEVTAALRALIQGKKLAVTEVAGIAVADLQNVVERLKNAKYAVLIWVAKDLDFAYADLTIQNITESVAVLNQKSRAMGLALGGSDGDTTVNYAHTWLSALAPDEHDITDYDAVVWVNSFSPDKLMPKVDAPVIAIGHPSMKFEQTPEVFIPVATPALDCAGTLFRVDSSVVLPLKQTRESQLSTLADVMLKLEALLS